MRTTREPTTDLILDGSATDRALGISGLREEEAAQKLDLRMRELEKQYKRTFVERGLILLEFEERKLWKFIENPKTGKPYPSMEQWIRGAAPYSRRDCFAAKKAVKDLRDIKIQSLLAVPRCNIVALQSLSASDRGGSITNGQGKTISVIEAAQIMPEREFLAEIGRQFALKSMHARARPLLGEPLSFRGLQHAPVNEQGVVFLFGMLAHELGFVVEMVTTGFPDCEAKRRVGKGRWERVRIEFEYQSRNFSVHGHDPGSCDLVVCWEDNWPECPIEVIELSSAIKELSSVSGSSGS